MIGGPVHRCRMRNTASDTLHSVTTTRLNAFDTFGQYLTRTAAFDGTLSVISSKELRPPIAPSYFDDVENFMYRGGTL